jgi:hypothetical protein
MYVAKSLNYGSNKPMASQGKPDILRFRSDNGQFNSGDTIRIEIPTCRTGMHLFHHNTYLEGKLRVNFETVGVLNNHVVGRPVIDQSVYLLFRRICVLHGNQVIEGCQYVNRIWNSVYDIQKSGPERNGDTINMLVNSKMVAGDIPVQTQGAKRLLNDNACGFAYPGGLQAVAPVGFMSFFVDFAFVLPSSVSGTLATKAIP